MATIMCQECGTIIQLGEWYEDVESKKISELQSTITAQADLIRRLKEDGERLLNLHSDSTICYCGYPDFKDAHTKDCPINLHTQLMSELEKREG
jgi:hypothetical protein